MRRTTVYLDRELEMRLRAEARRRKQPVAVLIREALHEKLDQIQPSRSPHAGSFSSGRSDTAARSDEVLAETGFGRDE